MIADAIRNTFAALSLSGSHPRDPAIAKMLGFGTGNSAGVAVTHEKVIALPAIKRAVQIIYDKMFSLPWYVFEEQEDGREYARNHPSWQCISAKANAELSDAAVRAQLVQWAMLWGNGCAYIDRQNWPNGPVELIPLLPDRTELVRMSSDVAERLGEQKSAGKLYYKTRIGDTVKLFERDDVLHIKGLGPNPYWGWDIVDLLANTFGGAIAKDSFSNKYFAQGANPVGFITMDGSLDEVDEQNYMRSLKTAMEGLGNAHKIVLLEEGAKFTPITFDPQKSQMLESKQFDIRLLAMAIGIKAHKLVDGANSAYASLEQANHEHKDDDILPWVNKWKKECNDKLLTEEQKQTGSHSIDVDDEALDWVPFVDRVSGAVELYNNGLITKDEGRRKTNYGPSRSPRAKAFRIPSNIVYEEDNVVPTGGGGAQATETKPEEPEAQTDDRFATVSRAYLHKIDQRLRKQAEAKAAKGAKEFLAWVDSLTSEEGPDVIQAQIDALYAATVERFNAALNKATTDEELRALLCD